LEENLSSVLVSGNSFFSRQKESGRELSSNRKGHQKKELITKVAAYNLNILARRKILRQSRNLDKV
jgi:hypothetical protein